MTTVEQIQADLRLVARLIRAFPEPLKVSPDAGIEALDPKDVIGALVAIMLPPADKHKSLIASRIEQFGNELGRQSGHIVIKFDQGKIQVECELNKPVCCKAHAEMIFRAVIMAYTNSHIREEDKKGWELTLERVTPLLYSVSQALVNADNVNVRTILRTEGEHA
jgi:hypothetical protein